MKKSLVVVALLVIAYAVASPYLALQGLRTAIAEGDAASLEDRVDFPSVRESLKAQFNTVIMAEAAGEAAGNPLGALAMGFATKLVEGFVDAAVTPAGLAKLAQGRSAVLEQTEPASTSTEPVSNQTVLSNARVERDTLGRFSAWIPGQDGRETRFVFRWRGLSWVLSAVEIPLESK